MNKIDISIIIPIYNVESYLRECLESVYAVNLLKEVILVNDGSTDHSLQIAEEFAKKYSEETILISQEHTGVSASEARNTGLKEARGEYVYFMDSDDFLDSKAFENFFYKIKGTDLEILHGTGRRYKSGKMLDAMTQNDEIFTTSTPISGKEFMYLSNDADSYVDYVVLCIYKKEYLRKNNLYFKPRITYEDILFSYIAFWKAKKIQHTEDFIYYYRQREGSITKTSRRYLDIFFVYDFLADFILQEKIEHPRITMDIISQIRSLSKKEKFFNDIVYKKLWKLPKKNIKSIRNLIDLYIRKHFCKKIFYESIKGGGNDPDKK